MYLSLWQLLRHCGDFFSFPGPLGSAQPFFDLKDDGSSLILTAGLKGIDPRTVQVQVSERSLAIGGYGTMEEKTEGPDFYQMQSAINSFYREIPLPARVDPHRATMAWQDGETLVITLPKW